MSGDKKNKKVSTKNLKIQAEAAKVDQKILSNAKPKQIATNVESSIILQDSEVKETIQPQHPISNTENNTMAKETNVNAVKTAESIQDLFVDANEKAVKMGNDYFSAILKSGDVAFKATLEVSDTVQKNYGSAVSSYTEFGKSLAAVRDPQEFAAKNLEYVREQSNLISEQTQQFAKLMFNASSALANPFYSVYSK